MAAELRKKTFPKTGSNLSPSSACSTATKYTTYMGGVTFEH